MSKALKTVIAVGAAIAMPWAAPALASSIGLSTAIGTALGSATAGSVIGGALTGAALNAATAAALGGNVRQAALMGAIGGGIGGYTAAPGAGSPYGAPTSGPSQGISLPGATAGGGTGAGLSVPSAVAPASNLGSTLGSLGTAPVDYSLAALGTPQLGQMATAGGTFAAPATFGTGSGLALGAAPTAVGAGLATAGMMPTLGAPTSFINQPSMVMTPTSALPASMQPATSFAPASAPSAVSPTPTTAPSAVSSAGAAQPRTFTEAVRQIPSEIAGRFTDPKALADMTLRAAGTLAGSALAGSGLSSQEQELLNEQVAELRQLRETNQALFNQRLEQAQNLIGESRYFDPEYFGLQRARRAQVAGAKAKQAGLRGLSGERAQAEARRFDIATGRETGTAYDVGYQTGIQGRLGTLQAGLQAMPGPMQMSPYADLRATLSEAERRRRERAGDIGSLFGSLTGAGQSRSRGPGGGP